MKHLKHKLTNNIYLIKSNISMIVLSVYYLVLSIYSIYFYSSGYYFVPENRIRLLKLLMVFILIMSFMIISPDRETHKISLFTLFAMILLTFSTGLFVCRIITSHLHYEATYTLLLCIVAISVTVASVFGAFKSYSSTDIFNSSCSDTGKVRPILKKLLSITPQLLNVLLVIIFIIFMFYSGLHTKKYTAPTSYATSTSPFGTYLIRTEQFEENDDLQDYICVYKVKKDIKVFMGKWTYNGKPVMKIKIDNHYDMNYVWITKDSFIAQGQTYYIKEN